MTDDGRMTPHRVCHCGRPVDPRNPDPWEGRMDDYCEDCATCRCDTSDSTCPHATSHPPAKKEERTPYSAAFPTEPVMCPTCEGQGELLADWPDVWVRCHSCDGSGEIEVCSLCLDRDDDLDCSACGWQGFG